MNHPVKTLAGVLALIFSLLLWSENSFANTLTRGYETKPTDDTWWCDKTKYTPRERIRMNMIKGRMYPPLKGRWDPDYTTPASSLTPSQIALNQPLAQPRPELRIDRPSFAG